MSILPFLLCCKRTFCCYYLKSSCIWNHPKFFLHYRSLKRVAKTIAHFFAFYSVSCIKSYKKGILVISYKGTHFSPYNLSLSLFNLSAWIINQILYKNHLSFASESVWVVLVPRGILVFSHQINFGQRGILKYLIFGNLFILVRFVIFNCFTLRCFQITFLPVLFYYLQFGPNFVFNCKLVPNFIFAFFLHFFSCRSGQLF